MPHLFSYFPLDPALLQVHPDRNTLSLLEATSTILSYFRAIVAPTRIIIEDPIGHILGKGQFFVCGVNHSHPEPASYFVNSNTEFGIVS